MSTLTVPICTSCRRPISPFTRGVRFRCPNCGEVEMWRCEKCRKQSNPYTCPKCGFIGP
ncbi:MAG: zinc finger domain-containing protein [Thermofilaceae archaeon]|nr:zinc finger domain-containing protein [Thermofilaceae archaeon]MCX8180590.1 zinc finger domain-containing protein [Thermofilaceae archaeon]MDW8003692.1 zinc finger domain-containing protein [Thermofilaceae archaeon]